MIELYLLHPISVHFPIALLSTGLVFELITLKRRDEWLPKAAHALLFLGTAGVAISVGLGLLAEDTVPHVPAAWEVLYRHKIMGLWTLGVFIFLNIWKYFRGHFLKPYFLLLWSMAVGLLVATAYFGGILVFHFGVGYLT